MPLHDQPLTRAQQVALVALRTLIGWHFLYEGWFKVWSPGWGHEGTPLPRWTSAGYLRAASGPLADLFHRLAASRLLPAIDVVVPVALLAVGLGLMLGLFTRMSGLGALALLALFYLSGVPTAGVHQAGTEGAYLIVNKTLVEAAAVAALLTFDTGRIAGLDLLRQRAPRGRVGSQPVPA
jgi:thiosulfate dehydrogenase (quinone) large subunit